MRARRKPGGGGEGDEGEDGCFFDEISILGEPAERLGTDVQAARSEAGCDALAGGHGRVRKAGHGA